MSYSRRKRSAICAVAAARETGSEALPPIRQQVFWELRSLRIDLHVVPGERNIRPQRRTNPESETPDGPDNLRWFWSMTVGAIPIGENDRLIGMVTDRDIVCKGLAQDSFDARRATARDVMTPGIHCCRDDDDLAKAVRHMEKLQVRRLPVINKSRRMIGILSLGDISNSAPGDLLSECVKSVSAHH